MFIPTLNPSAISKSDLDALMRIGFCYVKIPNEDFFAKIQTSRQIARDFFKSSAAEKAKWQLKEILKPGDRYEGYALRSHSENTKHIEQLFFEPDSPFGPYEPHAPLIHNINAIFQNLIFLPIISAIFKSLRFSEADFVDATTEPNCSLVFQVFPTIGKSKEEVRLNPHKDFGLFTKETRMGKNSIRATFRLGSAYIELSKHKPC